MRKNLFELVVKAKEKDEESLLNLLLQFKPVIQKFKNELWRTEAISSQIQPGTENEEIGHLGEEIVNYNQVMPKREQIATQCFSNSIIKFVAFVLLQGKPVKIQLLRCT